MHEYNSYIMAAMVIDPLELYNISVTE